MFCPISLATCQIVQIDFVHRRILALQGILCVFAPVIGGGYNNAVRKGFFVGCGKEAIHILSLDFVAFIVKLALDGVVLVCSCCFGDKVDTCV
jgi:hypothetical protein